MDEAELLGRLREARVLSLVAASQPYLTVRARPDDADDELDQFVVDQGGRLISIPSPESKGLGAGRSFRRAPLPPTLAYEIPRELLEP
jgi:hypothetical protein